MAQIDFTPNLARHVKCGSICADGASVRSILDAVCTANAQLRPYLLDDQERLRKHVTIFVDNIQIKDRQGLSDPVGEDSTIYIAQALSGG